MILPLQGIRVLDLSRLLPGPYCSQMLADFGADVVKVEDTERGDYLRDFPPSGDRWSVLYDSVNRNKRSIRLDLNRLQGRMSFVRLSGNMTCYWKGFAPG